ncbi:MAG: GNAT family N-acetyltransferase [Acidobacteria bacterium]|nr:GNAT family N-acetyltransferase [Acidobacteriota bacterium]
MPEIETARLRLRPCRPDDIDELARIRANPEVMKYIGDGRPQSRGEVKEVIREIHQHWRVHHFGRWAVAQQQDDTIIGLCGLSYLEDTSEVELGYTLAQPYWHQGFATEVAAAALRYGFAEVQLERIVAVAYPENLASLRVLEKIGMRFVKMANYYDSEVAYHEISRQEFHPTAAVYRLLK